MAKLALALALAPAVTAFAPVAAPKASTQLQASITETLATMEGPEIFWGSDGVLLGHDEADIKGYGERFEERKKEEIGLIEEKREDSLED